ncbi:E3 ubiquitin-protein ligase TRIM11-like [Halichoeres trimaculatus]|uniref:E3 ubiquitin-protein ligase TRIM11-like n=1 Tax=Halichoeres trimaculatus TaxID=147232 RepID=UPI003D9F5D21
MASNSLLSEEQLLCPICLDVFTRPVTTPCGHNFCMSCISNCWRSPRVRQCPVCKKTFERHPDLNVNTLISELSSQLKFLKVSDIQRPVKELDSCGQNQETAVKHCPECMTSHCAAHPEPRHRADRLQRHTPLEQTPNLEEGVCKKHTQPLSVFCKIEGTLLCDVCSSSDHSDHDVVPVQQAYEEAKAALEKTEDEVQQMMTKRQQTVIETKELVMKIRTECENGRTGMVQELASLASAIQQSRVKLLQVMEKKQKAAEKEASCFLICLRREINKLEHMEAKISELKEAEDPVRFLLHVPETSLLQYRTDSLECPSNRLVEIQRGQESLRKTVPELQKLLKEINRVIRELGGGTEDIKIVSLSFLRQYAVNIFLDPKTVSHPLTVSSDRKQVRYQPGMYRIPFIMDIHGVLGDAALSRSKSYFEVFVGGKTDWCLGIATESWRTTRFGINPGLWAIVFKENRFETHCNPNMSVHHGRVEQVGVFVNYQNNSIEFYDVRTSTMIYGFTQCSFKENLYPYLRPCDSKGGSSLEPMILMSVQRTEPV